MATGVVLDTSYLITLASPARSNHATARRYWKYFLDQEIPIFLSTIVASEFLLRQEIPDELLTNCIILPFNWDDATRTADLDFTNIKRGSSSRVAIKDDVKLLAQAKGASAEYIITEDEDLSKVASSLRSASKLTVKVLDLSKGFDVAFFNDGQRELGDDFGKDPPAQA